MKHKQEKQYYERTIKNIEETNRKLTRLGKAVERYEAHVQALETAFKNLEGQINHLKEGLCTAGVLPDPTNTEKSEAELIQEKCN